MTSHDIHIDVLEKPSLTREFFLSAGRVVLSANWRKHNPTADFNNVAPLSRDQYRKMTVLANSWEGDHNYHDDSKCYAVIVARDGDKTVGFVRVLDGQKTGDGDGAGLVTSLAVHPEYWGRGIAKLLLQKAERYIKDQGLNKAVLRVDEDNLRAVSLYERNGWTRPSEDVHVMNDGIKSVYTATLEKTF